MGNKEYGKRGGDQLINYRSPELQQVFNFVGGLDNFTDQVKQASEEKNQYTVEQAARLALELAFVLTPEQAMKAKEAIHGSSRLLAAYHLHQTYLGNTPRETDVVNATNVLDTALEFVSGEEGIPQHVLDMIEKNP